MHRIQESRGPEQDRHLGHLDRHHDGHANHDRHEAAHALARGLGWASIAFGALDLLAPNLLARKMGMRGKERLIQAVGVREVVTGVGILAAKNPAPWLWARVAGDMFDLATMATALHHGNRQRRNVAIGMGGVSALLLLDLLAAQEMGEAAKQRFLPTVDYSGRDGFPKGLAASRGAAKDFDPGKDFRTPEALRPWKDGKAPEGLWQDSRSGGATGKIPGAGHGDAGGKKAAAASAGAPLQQAAGSHERDDAFKTGSSFTGKGKADAPTPS